MPHDILNFTIPLAVLKSPTRLATLIEQEKPNFVFWRPEILRQAQ